MVDRKLDRHDAGNSARQSRCALRMFD